SGAPRSGSTSSTPRAATSHEPAEGALIQEEVGAGSDRAGAARRRSSCGHRRWACVADLDRPFRHRRLEPHSCPDPIAARGAVIDIWTADRSAGEPGADARPGPGCPGDIGAAPCGELAGPPAA